MALASKYYTSEFKTSVHSSFITIQALYYIAIIYYFKIVSNKKYLSSRKGICAVLHKNICILTLKDKFGINIPDLANIHQNF